MSKKPLKPHEVMREGMMDVPGAQLSYRLTGNAQSPLPLLVFENGWGASYHMWGWVQQELEPHAQLLFYSRAGVGGSSLQQPQTVPAISQQLAALLDALNLRQPVVIVGQSYGGLMCSIHAAQIPDRVRALVQVDPTPDQEDAVVDDSLKMIGSVAKLLTGLAVLHLPDPIFSPAANDLPPEDAKQLKLTSFNSAPSLRAARAELALIPQLREAAARPAQQPRLVISAELATEPASALFRKLVPATKARAIVERMQRLHQETAQRGAGSRWQTLPHTHGGLVFTRNGSQDTAASILEFVRALPPG